MRAWKKPGQLPIARVFHYFRAHPDKFFTEDHIAAQLEAGRRSTRKNVARLVLYGKLEAVETVSSLKWGRPKLMFRAIRGGVDHLDQGELYQVFGEKRPA